MTERLRIIGLACRVVPLAEWWESWAVLWTRVPCAAPAVNDNYREILL